jgi:hypothetical protein
VRKNSAITCLFFGTCLSPPRHGAMRCTRPRARVAVAPGAAGHATQPRDGRFHRSAAAADAANDSARQRPLQRARNTPCRREFISASSLVCSPLPFHSAVVSMAVRRVGGGILEQHPTDRRLCWHLTRIHSDYFRPRHRRLRAETFNFCGVCGYFRAGREARRTAAFAGCGSCPGYAQR